MIRLERRVDQPRWLKVAVPVGSILVALLIGAVITFFVTLAALYLFFVAPMNRYRTMTGQGGVDTRPPDVQLLEEIRDLLKQQANGTKSAD